MQTIPEEEKSKLARSAMPSSAIRECVLGMDWHVSTDEFLFSIVVPESCATKRGMLSVTNSLHDSLGSVLPVILRARLLYSKVCQERLG